MPSPAPACRSPMKRRRRRQGMFWDHHRRPKPRTAHQVRWRGEKPGRGTCLREGMWRWSQELALEVEAGLVAEADWGLEMRAEEHV
jgi:hypothetical protein